METLLYTDLQHLIAVKLCFFLFIILGLIGIYKKWQPGYFLVAMGVTSALAYYFLVRGMITMFWGFLGDEVFIAGLYEMASQGSLLSDFAYVGLPPFYPPLFFWLFGWVGQFFSWNGVQVVKLANLAVFLLFPLFFYLIQKWYWLAKGNENKKAPRKITWFLGAVLLFVFVDTDAIIIKQYEFVSASLSVLWTVFLLNALYTKGLTKRSLIFYGLTGGLLFMTFYFWFFLIAIGVGLFNLFYRRIKLLEYGSYIIIGVLILLFASPYWLPLALSYRELGMENWQVGFTYIERFKTLGPGISFSLKSLLMLFGLGSLIYFRKELFSRILLALFAAPYIWQAVGLITVMFYASPVQEAKGFTYFQTAVLALGFGYGVERLWRFIKKKYEAKNVFITAKVLGLFLLGSALIFGSFVDQPDIEKTRELGRKMRPGVSELVDYLKTRDVFNAVSLQSGEPALYAFLPINTFIYFNVHVSHPAANFSERLFYLRSLELVETSEEFFNKTQTTSFGPIDLFIFYKANPDYYPIYLSVDDFPNPNKEEIIKLPRDLFVSDYFELVFENNQYVVFEAKKL